MRWGIVLLHGGGLGFNLRRPFHVAPSTERTIRQSRPITLVIWSMALAHSKVTAQGQISVPIDVRRKLGIGPGSILEWDQDGDQIVVRRSARFTSEDIHRALFPEGAPKSRTVEDMKEGIRRRVRQRHARR